MIEIVEVLKIKLAAARPHLQLLAEPGVAERNFDGICAVRDEHDETIQARFVMQPVPRARMLPFSAGYT